MIGLGQIVTLGNSSNRIHEMRLFREVASVDDKEAEQGVLHSDVLRLNSRKEDEDGLIKRGLTRHLAKLWHTLKTKKPEATEKEGADPNCPITQARAESAIGENAPLGWLTYDQMSDGDPTSQSLEKLSSKSSASKPDAKDSLAFLKTDPEDHDYMFCEEWFLSPCG
jgi:hypothetical protein